MNILLKNWKYSLMEPIEKFTAIGESFSDAEASQMFGKKSYKLGNKAFICFFQECMVFKLDDPEHQFALNLPGAQLFDPSGKGRPMKQWVQVPHSSHEEWSGLAAAAEKYITDA